MGLIVLGWGGRKGSLELGVLITMFNVKKSEKGQYSLFYFIFTKGVSVFVVTLKRGFSFSNSHGRDV